MFGGFRFESETISFLTQHCERNCTFFSTHISPNIHILLSINISRQVYATTMPLLSLPLEILFIIVQMLDCPSLSALTLTNRYLNACFTNNLYRRSIKNDGWALHWAIQMNQAETARRFLQLGGSPNIRYDHDIEEPYLPPSLPLIESAVRNELGIASLLLEYGANVDMQDWSGATALYMASKLHNLAMVRLLLEHGADVRFSYGFHPRQSDIEKRVETYSRRVRRGVRVASAHLWREEVT